MNKIAKETFLCLFVLIAASLSSGRACADPGQASLTPVSRDNPEPIPGLHLNAPEIQVRGNQILARISGNIPVGENSLLIRSGYDYNKISFQSAAGIFSVEFSLMKASTELEFVSVDPYGTVRRKRTLLVVSDWKALNDVLLERNRKEPLGLTFGLSGTYLSLIQTNVPYFSEFAATGKFAIRQRLFSSDWDWNFGGYGTLASTKMLGLDLRMGHRIPDVPVPWQIELWLGANYSTMFVAENQFGYQNAIGPELAATFQRSLRPRDTLEGYFKFTTLSSGFAPGFSPGNHEFDLGLVYLHLLSDGCHTVGASVDTSFLNLSNAASVNLDLEKVSIGALYGF